MIKFSIIVPVYNVEPYLHQCITSILEQTYKNLEILCIDDGSTDDSGKILDEYAALDDRITVIHKLNAGYGHTLNLGITEASGDYVGIVESDDYISPDMFEKFANIIENSSDEIDVVKASYTNISKGGSEYKMLFEKERCGKIIAPLDYVELFFVQCSIWSAVYRRDFLINNDIDFLESRGASYQDMSFCFKVWAVAQKIMLINDSVYFYRTDNEASSVNSSLKIFCVCDEIREIDVYLKKHGLLTPALNGIKFAFMSKSYLWNYFRLHIGFRSAFWVVMKDEFINMAKSSDFDKKYWNEEEWAKANRVLEDPEKFFWNTNADLKDAQLDRYTAKNLVYKRYIKEYIASKEKIVIYGAGVFGLRVWNFMKTQGWQDKVVGFVVTKKEEQPKEIEGKAVYEVEEMVAYKDDIVVIVAVKEKSQQFMLTRLKRLQFKNVIRVDNQFIELIKEIEV